MGKEFPVPGTVALPSPRSPGRHRSLNEASTANRTSRVFGWVRYNAIGQLTGSLDYALIVLTSVVAGLGYHSIILQGDVPNLMPYVAAGNLVAALFVFGGASRGIYSPSAIVSRRLQVKSIIFFWSLAFSNLALFLFLAKSGAAFSRGTIIIFGVVGLALLLGCRLWISTRLKSAIARGTIACDRAVVIGDRDGVLALTWNSILQQAGAREIRRYVLPPFNGDGYEDGLRVIEEAIQFTRSNSADCVLLALQWNDAPLRNFLCEHLTILPLRVLLLPDRHVDFLFSTPIQQTRDLTVELQRPPLTSVELALKRFCDVLLASVFFLALIPLFLVVGLLITLDSAGPVIFSQRRRGFNGREFRIFKFRTMNARDDGSAVDQARRNDPRVTRVGRILRTTSIDELPQLLNVLFGQMSLVGPRPHAVAHDDGYTKMIAKYALRQHVKPGLTGWAQVNGYRGETVHIELMEQRVECDLWYIRNWSFWLDLRIILRTFFELARRKNAY